MIRNEIDTIYKSFGLSDADSEITGLNLGIYGAYINLIQKCQTSCIICYILHIRVATLRYSFQIILDYIPPIKLVYHVDIRIQYPLWISSYRCNVTIHNHIYDSQLCMYARTVSTQLSNSLMDTVYTITCMWVY